ncbi:MAG: histidine phosphatase family protein, partial [Candidatus Woesearchaeota archaeon]|nr:histidine phosphatase family protein [Candidatus Woesearchaeota archaeon]
MHLYLVRHGTSQQQRLMRGRMPGIHLTAKGRQEAENVARFLQNKKIDFVYASPLERTQETAEIIARKVHVKIITAPELNEWNLSCIQGITTAQIRKLPIWNNYWHHPTQLKNCETLISVAQRMT